jgi:hypothetical protein
MENVQLYLTSYDAAIAMDSTRVADPYSFHPDLDPDPAF